MPRTLKAKLALKRAFDILISTGVILVALPLFPILAVMIRLDSKGRVLYRQTRVGRGGKLFPLFKFRTMIPDAEPSGPVWSIRKDPRVTRPGGLLRRTGLDELPQLLNVLRGEMSLVGPRPERPAFVARFEQEIPGYGQRHQMRPGITGWAQVHGLRGDTSVEARTRFDLEYVKNWSFCLDLRILLGTPFVVETRDPDSEDSPPSR